MGKDQELYVVLQQVADILLQGRAELDRMVEIAGLVGHRRGCQGDEQPQPHTHTSACEGCSHVMGRRPARTCTALTLSSAPRRYISMITWHSEGQRGPHKTSLGCRWVCLLPGQPWQLKGTPIHGCTGPTAMQEHLPPDLLLSQATQASARGYSTTAHASK